MLFDFHYFLDDVQLNILLDRSVLITFAIIVIFLNFRLLNSQNGLTTDTSA